MRLTERQALAAEKAKALMLPSDYTAIASAIANHTPILFKYTDRMGVYSQYRMEYPDSFIEFSAVSLWPESVCLWSFHQMHKKFEQYQVEKIKDVQRIVSLLEAMLAPSRYFDFWDGSMLSLKTTPL